MKNPFDGVIQRAIPESDMHFLTLYYLPRGESAGNVVTTGPTYYISWIGPTGNSATFGVLNYVSRTKGRPLGYHYKKHPNGFSFSGPTIIDYATQNPTFSIDRWVMKEKTLPHLGGQTSWNSEISTEGEDGTVFQLKQVNTNVPTSEIFSGVWYTMHSNGNDVVPPVFNMPPTAGGYPFPQINTGVVSVSDNSILRNPYVMFIPYSTNMSYWNGGSCIPGGYNTSMLMINDWIITKHGEERNTEYKSHYTQKQCFGKLGSNSRFCGYIGHDCNGGLGFNYAKLNESCGKSYGACDGKHEGLACTWDSSGTSSNTFYCSKTIKGASTNTDPGVGNKNKHGQASTNENGNWSMAIIIGIVIIMFSLILLFYSVGHHKHNTSTTHTAPRAVSSQLGLRPLY